MIFRHRRAQRYLIVGSVGSSGLAGWRWSLVQRHLWRRILFAYLGMFPPC
jgi:hypothetical protein